MVKHGYRCRHVPSDLTAKRHGGTLVTAAITDAFVWRGCWATSPCDMEGTRIQQSYDVNKSIAMNIHLYHAKHREYPRTVYMLTMPLVGGADLNGTASGDPTDLRFNRP
eukprot:6213670-Pleurochrysis_carterae.AAC.1